MALLLRIGLILALAILLAAEVVYLAMNPGVSFAATVATNPILRYLNLAGLAAGLADGSLPAYLTLGLIVLIATPVVRVLSGIYYFHRGGERTMTAITIAVFVLLLVGILIVGPIVR
jgi:uncharacterized membrane protein